MKPAAPQACLDARQKACEGFDAALKDILLSRANGPAADVYRMLAYSFGFLDKDFREEKLHAGGKYFRSGLCLYLADAYKARDKAMDAALAIELFHNFTLIHDDIEDRDELRRDRPTLWKIWGVNRAINAGDTLSLIASEYALRAGPMIGQRLLQAFAETTEGQHLDIELTVRRIPDAFVTARHARIANEKKSAALIAVSAECAGLAAGKTAEECARLQAFGQALGKLFQLADDYRSVWQAGSQTGKDTHSDIREHKRTLPFFFAYEALDGSKKTRQQELYELPQQLTEAQIQEVLEIIGTTNAKQKTSDAMQVYADEARSHIERLSLAVSAKEILLGIVETLKA